MLYKNSLTSIATESIYKSDPVFDPVDRQVLAQVEFTALLGLNNILKIGINSKTLRLGMGTFW